jgi:hypothetical protein
VTAIGPDTVTAGKDEIDIGPDTVTAGKDEIDIGPDTVTSGKEDIDIGPVIPNVAGKFVMKFF